MFQMIPQEKVLKVHKIVNNFKIKRIKRVLFVWKCKRSVQTDSVSIKEDNKMSNTLNKDSFSKLMSLMKLDIVYIIELMKICFISKRIDLAISP